MATRTNSILVCLGIVLYTLPALVFGSSINHSSTEGVNGEYFTNSALGGQPATRRVDEMINMMAASDWPLPSTNGPGTLSARWLGMITPPSAGTYNFSVATNGGARLWVGDHLLLDTWLAGAAANNFSTAHAILGLPMEPTTPLLLRLEFIAGVASLSPSKTTFPKLQLLWAGNTTQQQAVPANALASVLPQAQAIRQGMRVEHANAGWGNWYNGDMWSQVLLPQACNLNVSLLDRATNQLLGSTTVFRQNKPAQVSPGPHSLYGSASNYTFYSEVTMKGWNGLASITIASATVHASDSSPGDLILQVLASDSSASGSAQGQSSVLDQFSLLITPQMQFGRVGSFVVNSSTNTIQGSFPGLPGLAVYASGNSTAVAGEASITPAASLVFSLAGGPVTLSTGRPRSTSFINATLAQSRAALLAQAAPYGDLAESWEAMHTVVAWNTIWEPHEGRITPVSRGWDFGAGYVLFDWDNLFLAYMASLIDRDLAYSNAIQIIKAKTVAGFVPNYSSGTYKSRDRTEPPIGVRVVSELYDRFQDDWFVDLLYPDLLSWNTWFWNYRRQPPLDLIVLGSDPNQPSGGIRGGENTMQDARYESGLDNSPMYDSPPVEYNKSRHHMLLYDVGMSSMYVMETQLLAEIASRKGLANDVKMLQQRQQAVASDLMAHCWDEESGLFSNVQLLPGAQLGGLYLRKAPTLFYPMLSGTATVAQVERMVTQHLMNATEFCVGQAAATPATCTYALPSIAHNDPAFPDNNYWRGRIWGPMTQLVYWGLSHPKYAFSPVVTAARKALCKQANELLLKEWRQYRHVHENYNAITGEGGDVSSSDPFYHWGALNGYISLLEAGYTVAHSGSE